jgi:hypothetical protein
VSPETSGKTPRFSVLAVDPAEALGADPEGSFELFRLTPDLSLVRVRDGLEVTGPVPPVPCLAVVAWSDEARPLLEAARAAFGGPDADLAPAVAVLSGPPCWNGIRAVAARGLERLVLRQSGYLARLAGELADARGRHEALQADFSALEQFFIERRVSLVEPAFVNEPDVPLALPPDGEAVSQLLPTSTKVLSAFALHVASSDHAATGALSVSLYCPERGEALWEWRTLARDLPAGWVTFGLPRTAGGLARSACLILRAEGETGSLRLSAGATNPLPAFRLGQLPPLRGGWGGVNHVSEESTPLRAAARNTPPSIPPLWGGRPPDPDRSGLALAASDGRVFGERSLALRTFVSPPGITIIHAAATLLPMDEAGSASGQEPFAAASRSVAR